MEQTTDDTLTRLKAATAVVPVGRRDWGRRLVSRILASVALALAVWVSPIPAHAVEDVDKVSATLQRMRAISPEEAAARAPFVELGAMDSKSGETKVDFLLRVGRMLDAFTGRTRQEACGAIMKSPTEESWRVRLITNRSQMACVRIIFPENGFIPTTETIHSHPIGAKGDSLRVRTNAMDMRLRGGWSCGSRVDLFDEDFSRTDVENGAGYLVARGKLLYLPAGEEKGQLVGMIDRTAPMDILTLSSRGQKEASVEGPTFSATAASTTPATPLPAIAVWSGKASGEGLPEVACPNLNNKNL